MIYDEQKIKLDIRREEPAMTLYGSNRSQHSPMEEEYEISYSTIQNMEIGEDITWSTENDDYTITCLYTDEYGSLIRTIHEDTNPYRNEDYSHTKIEYYEWIQC